MDQTEPLGWISQFGVAGVIGVLWVLERRAAAARERQINEAHERIVRERREMDLLLEALRENTRALTTLEVGQRTLIARLTQARPQTQTPRNASDNPDCPEAA